MIAVGVVTQPMDVPEPPLTGWQLLRTENYTELATEVPQAMPGVCVCVCLCVRVRTCVHLYKYVYACMCVYAS